MSISHDAYLFLPDKFSDEVMPYTIAIVQDPSNGYQAIRAKALDVFRRRIEVRKLADAYGAWDEEGLANQLPILAPGSPDDIAFWHVVLLYDHFTRTPLPSPIGLGRSWKNIQAFLEESGWIAEKRQLVVEGRSLHKLAENWCQNRRLDAHLHSSVVNLWNQIQPYSTSSTVGWLDSSDVHSMLGLLCEAALDSQQYAAKQSESAKEDDNGIMLLHLMLNAARSRDSGLGLILSG